MLFWHKFFLWINYIPKLLLLNVLLVEFHNHAFPLGFQFKCSSRFGVQPLCTQWPVYDLGFVTWTCVTWVYVTKVIVTWLTFMERLTYNRVLALYANLGLLNGPPLTCFFLGFFRHTSDLDIWNEFITSGRFLAKYEPRDKKTTGSHQQSGLLKKLILHIEYICTFKCIFEVFITWFAAQYFSISRCANIMQSRESPFVINRTDFSWNCKSLFCDGNNARLRGSTELRWPLESTSPSR